MDADEERLSYLEYTAKKFNWDRQIDIWIKANEDLTLAQEFEQIRREGPKITTQRVGRMAHIEMHLDRGDVTCGCYQNTMEK